VHEDLSFLGSHGTRGGASYVGNQVESANARYGALGGGSVGGRGSVGVLPS
jgi:hypothetical protein